MKYSFFLSVGMTALLIAGCSSTPTRVNTGKLHATTYSFVAARNTPAPDFADARERVHSTIQDSIGRNLAAKGLSKVASGGDVVVGYLVIVGDNASTKAINTYFGYGRDSSVLQDKAHKAYTSSKNPNRFRAGTLLIDIVDGKSFELLQRSFVVRPLLANPTAEVRAERIQEAVDAVLKDVHTAN